jgi:hypothetical protein
MARAFALVAATLVVAAGFLVPCGPALAAPGESDGNESEQLKALQATLDAALTEYNNAKGRYDQSVARQAELTEQQKQTEAKITELAQRAGAVATAAYMGRQMNMTVVLLDSSSSDGLLHEATMVQYLVNRDNRALHDLAAARKELANQQTALAEEIKNQQTQLATLDKKRKDADAAVKKAGGGYDTAGPNLNTAQARAAPRNSDGSFSSESATITDPTGTGGKITPRMLNAYNSAREDSYTRYTKCWRTQSSGEHPKGRACDFSSNRTTFVDARATGDDKAYGDSLASYFVNNASRLGVLYVIWYKRIWHPGSGWTSYGGDGTPAGDHYNHVHLSVQ